MKKVFTILPSLGDGGGERLAIDLSIKLKEKGYDVYIISLYGYMNTINSKLAESNNLKCIYLGKKQGIDLKLFGKIRKIFSQHKPDVVHSHLDTLLYLIPVLKRKQKKFHTIHSMAEKEAWGLQKLIRKFAFKIKKVVPVAISHTVADSISSYYNIEKSNIPIVYNGIDTKKYVLNKRKGNDCFTLINVGTLYEVKNQKFLIELFKKFNDKYANSKLLILGDGPLHIELEEKIKQMNMSDKIILVGKVKNVWDYLAISDIFVITSKYEGLPLSMIEAMSCGLPVVSSNVGGIKDVIEENINGFLIDFNDLANFINKFELLYQDKNLYERIKNNNLIKSKKFDLENITTEYIKLYEK